MENKLINIYNAFMFYLKTTSVGIWILLNILTTGFIFIQFLDVSSPFDIAVLIDMNVFKSVALL